MVKLILLSDVHIGTNAPSNWYQREVHEPFLMAALGYARDCASEIDELIFLGDLVDQWTYPPDITPPSFAAIAAANPTVFSPSGMLPTLLTALDGKVTYINGNHDMAVTDEDLAFVRDARGRAMKRSHDLTYTPSVAARQIVCTHGHLYSMFNAPDTVNEPTTGLPLGHFVTRLTALWATQRLGVGQSVVDDPHSGDPTGLAIFKSAIVTLLDGIVDGHDALSQLVIGELLRATGQPLSTVFRLLDGTTITADVVANQRFATLRSQWQDSARFPHDLYGDDPGLFALSETDMESSLGHFAELVGRQRKAKVVVMGHTHDAVGEEPHPWLLENCIYVNSGFNCPSLPEMRSEHPTLPVFVEIIIDEPGNRIEVLLRQITMEHEVADAPLRRDVVPLR